MSNDPGKTVPPKARDTIKQATEETTPDRGRAMRQSIQNDLRRYRQRQPAERSFWKSLGALGGVGWPIALSSLAGAWIGRELDRHWHTGVRLTLILLSVGAALGASIAWSIIEGTKR